MNDMSAPFTNCPESELACCVPTDRVESRVGRFSLRSEFARRLNLGNIRPKPAAKPGGSYRGSYAVCVTVAVTPLCVARPARREKD